MPAAVQQQLSWPELAAVLGQEHLRAATAADAVDGVVPRMVAEPGTAEELARCLRWARGAGLKVTPRGGGTKLGWGNPPAACDLLLSTARLDRVREHAWADMTVIADAGCRVADLQRTLAEHGQHLALDPLWPERATIGGILSTTQREDDTKVPYLGDIPVLGHLFKSTAHKDNKDELMIFITPKIVREGVNVYN